MSTRRMLLANIKEQTNDMLINLKENFLKNLKNAIKQKKLEYIITIIIIAAVVLVLGIKLRTLGMSGSATPLSYLSPSPLEHNFE